MSLNEASAIAPRPPRIKLAVTILLALAVVATVAGISLRAHDYHQLVGWTDAQEIPTVQLISPKTMVSGQPMTLPGHLQAWIDAPIHARVNGYLKRWDVDIGAKVKAGDLLGEIDTPELDQQLTQAKADLARARASAALAQVTAKRWTHLLSSNSVSKQESDEKSGQAEVEQANVQAAQANVDRLNALESFKRVVAPFSGTVTARNTDIGDLINAGSSNDAPLFAMADTSRMRLYMQIPQVYAGSIKPGMKVNLSVQEHPGKTYQATLMGSSGAVSQNSGSLLVQFEVDNPQSELLPGDYAEVEVPVTASANVVEVPPTVLLFRTAGPQVGVLDAQHKVVLRDVHISLDMGSLLQIDRGLKPGDRVIDNPPDSLSTGDAVRVASDVAASAHQQAG